MPWYARAHVRPLLGSAALHLLFIVVILVAAMRWRSQPPPTPLAIEGNVVRYEDLPRSVRSGRPLAEPEQAAPQPSPKPPPEPEPAPAKPEIKPEPAPDKAAAEAAALKQRQQAELQATQARDAKQRAEAETRRKAEAENAQQQAAAEAAAKAEQAAQEQREKAAAAQAARKKSEREAELRRQLAMEEEGEAVAQSGVTNEYVALLVQTIERNWNRPPSAKAGLECTLHVTQATGGTVIDVKIGDCNGDQAVRESVANAVYRSSPLPAPRDPRAFQRQLVIVFKPTE